MSQIFWRQSASARHDAPCLFLDRDGVLVREVGYLHRPQDVEVLEGAVELVQLARRRGMAVGVVTNQAGIGRGMYDWTAFEAVQDEIVVQLGGFEFDFVAACGAHPDADLPNFRVSHPWRKPAPGMLLAAAQMLGLELGSSVLIGDHLTDVEAARAAGVGRIVHVLTGHGGTHRAAVQKRAESGRAVILAQDLRQATTQLRL